MQLNKQVRGGPFGDRRTYCQYHGDTACDLKPNITALTLVLTDPPSFSKIGRHLYAGRQAGYTYRLLLNTYGRLALVQKLSKTTNEKQNKIKNQSCTFKTEYAAKKHNNNNRVKEELPSAYWYWQVATHQRAAYVFANRHRRRVWLWPLKD